MEVGEGEDERAGFDLKKPAGDSFRLRLRPVDASMQCVRVATEGRGLQDPTWHNASVQTSDRRYESRGHF